MSRGTMELLDEVHANVVGAVWRDLNIHARSGYADAEVCHLR